MKTRKRYGGLLRVSGVAAGGLAAAAAAAVCLLVWGCPLALMPEFPAGRKTATGGGDLVVRDYNLQAYVPVPTAGAAPVKAVEGRQDLEGSVVWTDAGGQALPGDFNVFVEGAVYRAAISLTAKGDYSFDPAAYFKYYPAEVVASQPAVDTASGDPGRERERSVTVSYKAAAEAKTIAAADFDLTLHVPQPVTGGSPVMTFYTGTFGGSVDWSPADGVFQGGTAYQATVILYPGPGYVFPGGSVPVIHNGAVSSPIPFKPVSGGTLAGAFTFPEASGGTEAALPDDLDLTHKVPAPVTGGTPVAYLPAPQYAGNVVWAAGVGGIAVPYTGVFQEGAAYTATVTLTAASGFTFAGVGANAFTHDGKDAAKTPNPANEAGSGTVTIGFPATTNGKAAAVSALDLTGRVPAPTIGGVPVTYFFPPQWPQYTGNVVWTTGGVPHKGLFQEGMTYTATVALTAASGFTFAGVGENAFTHDGKDAEVTNGANPERVTVVFPALGGGETETETEIGATAGW